MIKFFADTELTIKVEILDLALNERDIAEGLDGATYKVKFGKSTHSEIGTVVLDDKPNKVVAKITSLSAMKDGDYYDFERKR